MRHISMNLFLPVVLSYILSRAMAAILFEEVEPPMLFWQRNISVILF